MPLESIESDVVNEPPQDTESDFHTLMVEKLALDSVSKINECENPKEPKTVFFCCNLCDYKSESLGFFNRHKKSHKICAVCDEIFSGSNSTVLLNNHMKKHAPKTAPKPKGLFLILLITMLVNRSARKSLRSQIAPHANRPTRSAHV